MTILGIPLSYSISNLISDCNPYINMTEIKEEIRITERLPLEKIQLIRNKD